MKKTIYTILTVIALASVCSCQKENRSNARCNSITFGYNACDPFDLSITATKGSLSNLSESTISDMRIFVTENGEIIADEVLDESNCTTDISRKSGSAWKKSAEGIGKGLIKLDLSKAAGGSVNIYAIANCKKSNILLPTTFETEQNLLGILVQLKDKSVSRQGNLPMTATILDANPTGITGSLVFKRLDAKVLVKVDCTNGLKFDPAGWSVDDIPSAAGAFNRDTIQSPFSSNEGMFDGNSFSFYTLPTKKKITVNIGGALYSSNSRSEISYAFSFEPKCNTLHTCTVTIEGVNSIRVNVDEDAESDSAYKGSITDIATGGVQIVADAHYETKVIVLDKNSINEEFSGCTASTADANWVSFMLNKVDESGSYIQTACDYPGIGSKALIVPADLYRFLQDAHYDSSGKIYLTVFIDENFNDGTAWNVQTNKTPRTMAVLCSKKTNSKTGNSVVKTLISIVQHSVQTVYVSSCLTAWGVECINESNGLPYDSTTVKKNVDTESFSNGRLNSFKAWGFVKENKTTFTPRKWAELKTDVESYLRYACIGRNRDENGDGLIDASELKWYTAADEQLIMLWMGNDVIYNGARVDVNNPTSSFRCVRNLNMGTVTNSNPNVTFEPQKAISYSSGVFDANNFSRSAMRNKTSGELEQNYEYEESNRISDGFILASSNSSFAKESIISINAKVNAGKKICPEGYRLPNQRELMLMSYYCKKELSGTVSLCRTLYSNRLEGAYYSWIWDNSFQQTFSDKQTASFRCVKDK